MQEEQDLFNATLKDNGNVNYIRHLQVSSDNVNNIAISATGDRIVFSYDKKISLFGRDSSSPLWTYSTGNSNGVDVDISADSKYIVAGGYDQNVYLFDKSSNTPLWSYTSGGANFVSISADGKYIGSGSTDDNLYLFKNSLPSRPTLIPYGPRDGTDQTSPILRWFGGSDNPSNLVFDVYLDTNSNPTTKVANDISSFEYTPSNLTIGTKYY